MTTGRSLAGPAAGRASGRTGRIADAHPVGPPRAVRAESRAVPRRLGEPRERVFGRMILAIALTAVAGPLIVAVAAMVIGLVLILAAPFLLSAMVLVVFAVVVLGAIGAAG